MQLRSFHFHSSNRSTAIRTENPSFVEVTGLSSAQLRAVAICRAHRRTVGEPVSCRRSAIRRRECSALTPSPTTRCGSLLSSRSIAGRPYVVRFDPSHVPGADAGAAAVVVATVTVPATHVVPSTTVARIYPSGDTVPENLLRIYVEFSGPMGRPSGIPHMKLLGSDGREIEGAFLPLDYEFWDPAHTRFTAFLDPGRVKSGILPNKQMGRALDAGRTVTLVISPRVARRARPAVEGRLPARVFTSRPPVKKPARSSRHGASSRRPRAVAMRSS